MSKYFPEYIEYQFTITIKKKQFTTTMRLWPQGEKVVSDLKGMKKAVMCELYKRLRKYPEFDRAVAIVLPQTELVIFSKYNMSAEEYKNCFRELIEDEIISIVASTDNHTIIEFNRKWFITNSVYYSESSTDAKLCKDFFEPYVISGIADNKNG